MYVYWWLDQQECNNVQNYTETSEEYQDNSFSFPFAFKSMLICVKCMCRAPHGKHTFLIYVRFNPNGILYNISESPSQYKIILLNRLFIRFSHMYKKKTRFSWVFIERTFHIYKSHVLVNAGFSTCYLRMFSEQNVSFTLSTIHS